MRSEQAADALGHVTANPIVHLPRGVDQIRVVTHALGFVQQVIRVHTDAMPADQTGPERQEIPLGAGGFEHIERVDAELVEDQRQLVDQRNVDVALDVLHHLGRFGHADRFGAPGAGRDDAGVERIHRVGGVRCGAGGDLANVAQPPLPVTRVDALGAVATEEISIEPQPGGFFEQRHADFFGGAGVHRRFVDHQIAWLECGGNQHGGTAQWFEVRLFETVDGRGHGDDEDRAARKFCSVGGVAQLPCSGEFGIVQFQRGIVALLQLRHALGIDIEAQRVAPLTERDGQRQADVAKPDDGNVRLKRVERRGAGHAVPSIMRGTAPRASAAAA